MAKACGLCGTKRTRIVNVVNLDVSDVVRCEHCDVVCNRPRCPTCARLLKTVRVLPTDGSPPPNT